MPALDHRGRQVESQERLTKMGPDPKNDSAADAEVPAPEDFWAEILSADPKRVRSAFDRLSADDARLVQAHLLRMSNEAGWHPLQRDSARAALQALEARSAPPAPEDT